MHETKNYVSSNQSNQLSILHARRELHHRMQETPSDVHVRTQYTVGGIITLLYRLSGGREPKQKRLSPERVGSQKRRVSKSFALCQLYETVHKASWLADL